MNKDIVTCPYNAAHAVQVVGMLYVQEVLDHYYTNKIVHSSQIYLRAVQQVKTVWKR